MTEKNIVDYKLFLSLNISDFRVFFYENCNLLKKITTFFPNNPPLKIEVLSNPLFWKFGRRFNPHQKGVVHAIKTIFLLYHSWKMFPIASQILGNNGFVRNKMIKYQRLSCKSNNFKFYEMQWFLHNSFFSDIRCSHCSMHPFYVRTKKNGSVCLFFNSELFWKCSYFVLIGNWYNLILNCGGISVSILLSFCFSMGLSTIKT